MGKNELAVFGCGCFWGIQYVFDKIKGVTKTEVGYMGGDENKWPDPSYDDVCKNETGYAEVVRIEYDPEKISYDLLLDVFWRSHDPTTINQQAADFGTQYRSVIFYYDSEQKKTAEESLKKVQKLIAKKIVTQISKAGKFIPAEDYHQKYADKNGPRSCHIPRNPYLN